MRFGGVARRLVIAACASLSLGATPVGAPQPAPQGYAELLAGAFADAQMAVSGRTGAALVRGAARLAAADPRLAALVEQRDRASAEVASSEAAEAELRGEEKAAPATLASAVAREAAARARLAAAGAMLVTRFPAYAQLTDAAPLTPREAEALLAPDEAILLVQSTATATYLFAIRHDHIVWLRSAADAAGIAADVAVLRRALDPLGLTRAGEDAAPDVATRRTAGFPRARAYALYQAVWAPVAAALADARLVFVVSGGALAALPAALLVASPPAGNDADPTALRATDWLVRHRALATLPSIASLRALRAAQPRRAARAFAGYGAPLLAGTPLATLPALPGARAELVQLAAAAGGDSHNVITGRAATEARVAHDRLGDIAVLAFATHALLAGERGPGGEPALVLTPSRGPAGGDGLLTASEAARLDLAADWVVLSACNTAADDGTPDADGLSGLVRGFFSAGARAVLASHWRVRDDAVAALTVATLRGYRADRAAGHAEALRGAMLAMLDDRTHPERANPAYWAPFVIAGEGR